MSIDFSIEPVSEDTLLLRLGDVIDIETNGRVHAAARAVRAARLPAIVDVAPAYATLLVRFDPLAGLDFGSAQPFGRIEACMRSAIDAAVGSRESPPRRPAENTRGAPTPPLPRADSPPGGEGWGEGAATRSARVGIPRAVAQAVEIPVCYGGDQGPDLAAVAARAHLTSEQVIARHVARECAVAMIGFAPGFPYLLGLDPALAAPRRANPRTRVPPGSVAIGGAQTGIYPRELPGGWNLIGRTPRVLFDPARDPPCLLAPGDRVRFRAIGADEFARLAQAGG